MGWRTGGLSGGQAGSVLQPITLYSLLSLLQAQTDPGSQFPTAKNLNFLALGFRVRFLLPFSLSY